MTKPAITSIAPFFIVRDVPAALAFYCDRLGFEVTFRGPADDSSSGSSTGAARCSSQGRRPGTDPEHIRDTKKGWARWDAYLHVPDPDALAAEFSSRSVAFSKTLKDEENRDDGLRGFEVQDADGYVLFFGRPRERQGGRDVLKRRGYSFGARTSARTLTILARSPGTRSAGRQAMLRLLVRAHEQGRAASRDPTSDAPAHVLHD